MKSIRKKAVTAALALLLILSAACGKPSQGSSTPESSSAPESSSQKPESLEYEQEHDHTGIPGLDLPESLPAGDYAFEAYDSSQVGVSSMVLTINGEVVDAIVLTVPKDTKNYVECYADGVLVQLSRLDEGGEAGYLDVRQGSLTGDDQWSQEDAPMKNGDRYDITFGEPGLFRLSFASSDGAADTYYFLVSEG